MNDKTDIKIVKIISAEVQVLSSDGDPNSALRNISLLLSETPSQTWEAAFINAWEHEWRASLSFKILKDPITAIIARDKILLLATTLDDVDKYYKKTLKACVAKANKIEAATIKEQLAKKKLADEQEQADKEYVEKRAKDIKF